MTEQLELFLGELPTDDDAETRNHMCDKVVEYRVRTGLSIRAFSDKYNIPHRLLMAIIYRRDGELPSISKMFSVYRCLGLKPAITVGLSDRPTPIEGKDSQSVVYPQPDQGNW